MLSIQVINASLIFNIIHHVAFLWDFNVFLLQRFIYLHIYEFIHLPQLAPKLLTVVFIVKCLFYNA